MTVRTLDRAVLVCDARIVARWRHTVVVHQRGVALCQILPLVATRLRNAADRLSLRCSRGTPPSVHRAFCKPRPGRRSFTAEHDMGMLEAGERQPEVIEPVIERLTRDGNAERACVGEVGQTQTARLVLLAKITSCSGPLSARQALMRRSSVRRILRLRSGCRRRSSSSTHRSRGRRAQPSGSE